MSSGNVKVYAYHGCVCLTAGLSEVTVLVGMGMSVHACARVCVCVCVRACVRVCVRACVRACVYILLKCLLCCQGEEAVLVGLGHQPAH